MFRIASTHDLIPVPLTPLALPGTDRAEILTVEKRRLGHAGDKRSADGSPDASTRAAKHYEAAVLFPGEALTQAQLRIKTGAAETSDTQAEIAAKAANLIRLRGLGEGIQIDPKIRKTLEALHEFFFQGQSGELLKGSLAQELFTGLFSRTEPLRILHTAGRTRLARTDEGPVVLFNPNNTDVWRCGAFTAPVIGFMRMLSHERAASASSSRTGSPTNSQAANLDASGEFEYPEAAPAAKPATPATTGVVHKKRVKDFEGPLVAALLLHHGHLDEEEAAEFGASTLRRSPIRVHTYACENALSTKPGQLRTEQREKFYAAAAKDDARFYGISESVARHNVEQTQVPQYHALDRDATADFQNVLFTVRAGLAHAHKLIAKHDIADTFITEIFAKPEEPENVTSIVAKPEEPENTSGIIAKLEEPETMSEELLPKVDSLPEFAARLVRLKQIADEEGAGAEAASSGYSLLQRYRTLAQDASLSESERKLQNYARAHELVARIAADVPAVMNTVSLLRRLTRAAARIQGKSLMHCSDDELQLAKQLLGTRRELKESVNAIYAGLAPLVADVQWRDSRVAQQRDAARLIDGAAEKYDGAQAALTQCAARADELLAQAARLAKSNPDAKSQVRSIAVQFWNMNKPKPN